MSWLKQRRERKAREAAEAAARVEAEAQAQIEAARREAEEAEARRVLLERVERAKVAVVTAGSLMRSALELADRRIEALTGALSAARSGEFSFNGVQLVEPRVDNSIAKLLLSMGIKGITLPKREAMTVMTGPGGSR